MGWPVSLKISLLNESRRGIQDFLRSELEAGEVKRISAQGLRVALKKKPLRIKLDPPRWEMLWDLSGGERGYADISYVLDGLGSYRDSLIATKVLFDPLGTTPPRRLFGRDLTGPRELFRALDRDRTRTISLRELQQGLKRLDLPMSIDVQKQLLSLYELDGDGRVSEEEFLVTSTAYFNEGERFLPSPASWGKVTTLEPFNQASTVFQPPGLKRPKSAGVGRKSRVGCMRSNHIDGGGSGGRPRSAIGHRKHAFKLERQEDGDYQESREEGEQDRVAGWNEISDGSTTDSILSGLIAAVQGGRHSEVKRMLLHRSGNPGTRLRGAVCPPGLAPGSTLLHLACKLQHMKVVRVLCLCGVDIYALDEDGMDAVSLLESSEDRNALFQLGDLLLQTEEDNDGYGSQDSY